MPMLKSFYLKTLFLLLLSGLFSAELRAQCDNLKPMFGDNCTKPAELRKTDEAFRQAAIKQSGSPDSAARTYLYKAWEFFQQKKDSAAMQTLNQAWLLNPENPNVYFAFGHLVRYSFQKNAVQAERYYKLG